MFEAFFGALLSVFNFWAGGLVALAGVITSLFFSLSVSTLNAVISTGFVSLSYTNPDTNPFIRVGWELTRGLTNIIFVLALLAIGIGTALKLNDYQAKKALPLLIIIALLINFTPVILGIIVDASNIVMNYFLSSGFQGGSVLGSQLSNIGNLWAPTTEGVFNPAVQGNRFIALLVIVFFNVIAAFIFFIFSSIFLMRYVIIWLLVILSPIAFASYILPSTRQFFKQWWTQFLQWTFVGVTAGFFLYLANQLINLIINENKIVFASQSTEGFGLLNSILPWAVIIIFLILGLQAAMNTSAQGANIAVNAMKKTGGFAGRRAASWARALPGVGKIEKWAASQAMAGPIGAGIKGRWGGVVRGATSVLGINTLRRGTGSIIAAGINTKAEFNRANEESKKRSLADNVGILRSATATKTQKGGIIKAMIENKQFKDANDADVVGAKNVLKSNELIGAYGEAVRFKDSDTQEAIERATIGVKDTAGNLLANGFANIIREATKNNLKDEDKADENGLTKKDIDRGYTSYSEKIISESQTIDEIKQLKKGWWANDKLMESAQKFWGGHQIGEAARTFGRGFSDKFQGFAQEKGIDWYFEMDEIVDKKTGKKNYKTRNPDVPKYLTGTGALVLGMGIPGVSAAEVNQRTTESRILEKSPSLSGAYKQYRAIRETRQHIEKERAKGASQTAINQTEATLRQEEASLKDNLNILYGANPKLEKEWDAIEQAGKKKEKGQQMNRQQKPAQRGGGQQRRGPNTQPPPPGWTARPGGIVTPPPPGHKKTPTPQNPI